MDDMDRSPPVEPEGSLAVADGHGAHDATADGSDPLHLTVGRPPTPPDWWHRDHPTFTAISGFFSGLAFATLAPGLFVATVRALTDERTAEEAFPFVLLFLAIPIALVSFPQTRRFGKYLFLGIVVALLVVFGVGTVVFWLMVTYSS